MAYDLNSLIRMKDLKAAAQRAKNAIDGKADSGNLTHETHTYELEDGSTVTKEIVLWNSQA